LAGLPVHAEPKLDPFTFRVAQAEEELIVSRTVLTAFSQDLGWTEDSRVYLTGLEAKVGAAFSTDPALCVVVQHGTRVIGASVLSATPDAANHLLTGPCILHEYRSRGIGSVLLHASLRLLRAAGLSEARGLTPTVSPAAKYVYPKFGGVAEVLRGEDERVVA
jgi:GNAT superfamily N-acetyltransferase